jgi:hypothetical protein
MSRQVHFVIAVDVDDKNVFIDDETYSAKFDLCQGYWDTEKEQWIEDEDGSLYYEALAILNNKAQLERD